jgi:hypothetical protein
VSRRIRTGALAIAVAVGVLPVAAACSAGYGNATEQVQPDHPAGQIGNLKVQNVNVVLGADGAPSVVVASIVNLAQAPDALSGVSVNGTAATLTPPQANATPNSLALTDETPPPGAFAVPSYGTLRLGGDGTPGVAVATLPTGSLMPGTFTPITFAFATSGVLTMQAYVTPATGVWAGVTANAPTSSATPTATITATTTTLPTGTATVTSTSTSTATKGAATPTGTPSTTPTAKPTH